MSDGYGFSLESTFSIVITAIIYIITILCFQSTSNYLARRFGVRAAMPGFIAMKLCPDLVIVKVSFDKYRKVSKTVQEVLVEYDPNLSPVGLDESYLDLTAYVKQRLSESETSTSTEQGRGGSLSSNVKGCVPSIGCDSAEDEPLSQSTRLTTGLKTRVSNVSRYLLLFVSNLVAPALFNRLRAIIDGHASRMKISSTFPMVSVTHCSI